MMEKKLIVNADGFGFTPGVNRGIIESIKKGIVRSTSALANMPAIEEITNFQKQFPEVSIGIHFNLSVGRPVSPPNEVKSLVNAKGEFLGEKFVPYLLTGKIRFAEMVKELENQVKRLVEDFGITLTHFDGHQNKHLYPQFFFAALKVAKRWNISFMRSHNRYLFFKDNTGRFRKLFLYYLSHPQRLLTHSAAKLLTKYAHMRGIKTPDRLITPGYVDSSKKSFLETWLMIIEKLPEGVNEIYCHPGYPDDLLAKYATYVEERKIEVEILTSRELKKAIRDKGVQLISFKDLI
ncbi:MAG: hypothetical protein DRG83_21780 [Deltaproteobacteria bacterium]|nr:MAG: hypothetical protein DRG83_21780 [Deltaproteobacteria bacterium]